MVLVYAVGHLSGAHINPAVTIAFTLTRHFPRREALTYIAAQLTGAALAGLLLLAIWPGKPGNLGANAIGVVAGLGAALEIVLSALLMFVIMAVATDTRAVGAAAAIAVGGVVLLDILVGGGVSGASMNPARSFGPALASGTWDALLDLGRRARSSARRSAASPTSSSELLSSRRRPNAPDGSRSFACALARTMPYCIIHGEHP